MSESIVLAVMVGVLCAGIFALRIPTGVSLFFAALAGSLASGNGLGLRYIAEGSLLYLDPLMIVASSLFFMAAFERSGALATMNVWVVKRFGNQRALLIALMMLLVMFPGMFTGLTAPCVLTTGAMIAPVLLSAGVPPAVAGAFIAAGAFYGMVAPPVNICAMLICGGVDMPYIGFDWPLLLMTLPLALLTGYLILYKRIAGFDTRRALASLPESRYSRHGAKLFLPLFALAGLLLGEKYAPSIIPHLGIPLIFLLSALLALFTGDKVSIRESASWTMQQSLPILALLVGIGAFIEVLTLSGARGWIVVTLLALPDWQLYLGMALLVPLFGGVSAYGASVVLGVPILLSFLDRSNILVAAALSMLASVGDFVPPTRLAVILAGPVVGEPNPTRILKHSIWPIVLGIAVSLGVIYFAKDIAKLIGLA